MFALSKQIACWSTLLGSSVSLQAPALSGVESLPLHLVAGSLRNLDISLARTCEWDRDRTQLEAFRSAVYLQSLGNSLETIS